MNLAVPVASQFIDLPNSRHAEAIVRAIETAADVQRRHQFFIWVQSYLQVLLPHQISVCAAYQRADRKLVFETFYNVPVPADLLAVLGDRQSTLLCEVARLWVAHCGGCVVLDVAKLGPRVPASDIAALRNGGLIELLAHGVARPQRPAELESLFVLGACGQRWEAKHRAYLDLLLPHLHTTYVRVQVNEHAEGLRGQTVATTKLSALRASPITAREAQILRWVREGKHNVEIATVLAISPLTVKNHIQKILRKLGAANRAQAVAQAIDQDLL